MLSDLLAVFFFFSSDLNFVLVITLTSLKNFLASLSMQIFCK